MKKIIVFGATGGTGKLVVQQALQAGYFVTVVVRNPAAFTIQHPQLEIIKGDVFQPPTFENAIKGKDAVISCLGIARNEPTTVYSEGIKKYYGSDATSRYTAHYLYFLCGNHGAA